MARTIQGLGTTEYHGIPARERARSAELCLFGHIAYTWYRAQEELVSKGYVNSTTSWDIFSEVVARGNIGRRFVTVLHKVNIVHQVVPLKKASSIVQISQSAVLVDATFAALLVVPMCV